jgi:hypothetical protein
LGLIQSGQNIFNVAGSIMNVFPLHTETGFLCKIVIAPSFPMIPLSFTHRSLPTIFRIFPPHSVRISQLFVYRLRALMPFQSTPAHSQSISTVPVPPSILCSFPVISLLIPHRFPVNSMLIFHRFPAHL